MKPEEAKCLVEQVVLAADEADAETLLVVGEFFSKQALHPLIELWDASIALAAFIELPSKFTSALAKLESLQSPRGRG